MRVSRTCFVWVLLAGGATLLSLGLFLGRSTPPSDGLDAAQQGMLLRLAREQLAAAAHGRGLLEVDATAFAPRLFRKEAAFVTLTIDRQLRGCMLDAFEAHEPLYRSVLRNTLLAATGDPRFSSVLPEEVDRIRIAISILSPPKELPFERPDDLLAALHPGIDGAILTAEDRTSTFLPTVWETFPDPSEFLSQLCEKAGLARDRWRSEPYPLLQTYRVLAFAESSTETGESNGD